jgi:hypothetical protein
MFTKYEQEKLLRKLAKHKRQILILSIINWILAIFVCIISNTRDLSFYMTIVSSFIPILCFFHISKIIKQVENIR